MTMKNVSSKKGLMTVINHPHIEPPLIPLIQETHDFRLDKYFVKLKLRRDPTSSTLNLYEFKMSLIYNGKPEEFLFFVRNFNMTLAASGTLEAGAKVQYICTIIWGEALLQFDLWSDDVESMQTSKVDDIIKRLEQSFSSVNLLSKQKRAMRCGMKNYVL